VLAFLVGDRSLSVRHASELALQQSAADDHIELRPVDARADRSHAVKGNDIYYVDNDGDFVLQAFGEGTDRVRTSVSYALREEIEILETTDAAGTTSINLTGNSLNNTIIGNNGSNEINGERGTDTMEGRGGSDTYFVDNIGDVALESGADAFVFDRDVVKTITTYALTAGSDVEYLVTLFPDSNSAIDLTGNSFGQTIKCNNGSNIIAGLGGLQTGKFGTSFTQSRHGDNIARRKREHSRLDDGYLPFTCISDSRLARCSTGPSYLVRL
jgi:RTX calcium-binding nonapeptide repeat (4 copies)